MAEDCFEIIYHERIAPAIYNAKVLAPAVTRRAKAGQFVIIRVDDHGERIPLTLVDFFKNEGSVELVYQVVGTTTYKFSQMKIGDRLADVVGPLGHPTVVERFGKVVCVGGGVGIGAIYPIARSMIEAGNDVTVLLGARDGEHLILHERIRRLGVPVKAATEDGSIGVRGFVTELLKEEISSSCPDRVIAVGPLPMMKAVSDMTKSHHIPTVVSLNAIMLDGTGMCGTCRCEVGGETKFSCVDGPEFDGHQVDFENLAVRLSAYKDEEALSWERFRVREGK